MTNSNSTRDKKTPARKAKFGNDDWTLSPETAAKHMLSLCEEDRSRMINNFKSFSQGSNGGQIEPWSLYSVRDTVYPGWTNDDFLRALRLADLPEEDTDLSE